jgi:hypothetical protein
METTSQLHLIQDRETLLDLSTTHVLWDTVQDTDDGTFPNVMSYQKLAKNIDSIGPSAFLQWVGLKKDGDTIRYYNLNITRTDHDKVTVSFDSITDCVIAHVNKAPVPHPCKGFKGEVEIDWYSTTNARQSKYASSFDILIRIKEIL